MSTVVTPDHRGTSRIRTLLRRVSAILLVTFVVVVVLFATLVVLKPKLDVSFVKSAIEAPLSAFMERPVSVERAWVVPGAWTRLIFTDLRIEAAGADPDGVFAHSARVELELELVPLFKRKIRLRALEADGFDFDIRRSADGSGNWPIWTTFTYEIVDLGGIDFRHTSVRILDEATGSHHDIELDLIQTEIGRDRSLEIELEGELNNHPISLQARGPSFTDLDGNEAWTLETAVGLAGVTLDLDGEILSGSGSERVDLVFDVEGEHIEEAAAAIGIEVPAVGPLHIAGRLRFEDGIVAVSDLEGSVSETVFAADLAVDTNGRVPEISGQIAVIDLDRWVGGNGTAEGDIGLESVVKVLDAIEAHVAVTVQRVSAPGVEIEDLEMGITIADGVLDVPVTLTLDSIPLELEIGLQAMEGRPHLTAALEARRINLDRWPNLGIHGTLDRLEIVSEARGSKTDELVAGLQFRARADGLALRAKQPDGATLEIPIRALTAHQDAGSGIRATAVGRHSNMPFSVELDTTDLRNLMAGGVVPVRITAEGGGGTGIFNGHIDLATFGSHLSYTVAGGSIGGLAPWIGISPTSNMAYRFSGKLLTLRRDPRLIIQHGRLGTSHLTAEIELVDGSEGRSISAWIEAPVINIDELMNLRPPDGDEGPLTIHDSIVPTGIEFPDATLEISVGRVIFGDWDLAGISTSLRSRDGRVESSPVRLVWEDQVITGALSLDLRGNRPEVDLFATSSRPDLARVATVFAIEDFPAIEVGQLDVEADLRGSTIDQINRESYLSVTMENLHSTVPGVAPGERWDVAVSHVQADAIYGRTTTATAMGTVNHVPLELEVELEIANLNDLFQEGQAVRFFLTSGETELDVSTSLVWPFDPYDVEALVLLSGPRLDGLNPILGTDLPPIGPYSIDGRLTVAERNYDLADLVLEVGASTLTGELGIFEGEDRPIIAGRLASHRPRIEDFLPQEIDSGREPGPASETAIDIDPAMLQAIDADLSLDVDGLEWGDRGPGSGRFSIELENGQLTTTANWDQPHGGSIDAVLEVEADGPVFTAAIDADIDRMSYGPLRPFLAFEGGDGGLLSLDTGLSGSGGSLDEVFRNIEGHLDFTTYPESHHAALFNLWGGQLIDSVLPLFGTEDEKTRLNCTIARLEIAEGRIVPRTLIFDASRTRIRSKGSIDLRANLIKLKATPRPKRRGFISLATPVHIEGALDDPDIRVDTGGLAVTALRVSTFFVTLWFELFKTPLPEDGSDICVDPPERKPEVRTTDD